MASALFSILRLDPDVSDPDVSDVSMFPKRQLDPAN